jgi:hypothetical protein
MAVATDIKWLSDEDDVKGHALRTGKPILIDFRHPK